MKGNIDVKIFEPKKMRVRSVGEKLWMKLPGWFVRARGPRGDANETKGLGPWRPLGTTQFWESLERNLMCYLNQQVTCILEIYMYVYMEFLF